MKSIGLNAFAYNQITSINLPENLITVGANAFVYNKLTKLNLPDSLISIDMQAFMYNDLTELTLPKNLKKLGVGAFDYNPIKKLTVEFELVEATQASFGDSNIETVIYKGNLKTIYHLFDAQYLKSLTIPEGVTTIKSQAFFGIKLNNIRVQKSVTTIGNYAF